MKKFLILALSAALVLTIFTGCRRNVSDSTDGMIDDTATTGATRNTEPRHTTAPTRTTEPSTRETQPTNHATQPSTHGTVNTEPEGNNHTNGTGTTDATGGARSRGRIVPGNGK